MGYFFTAEIMAGLLFLWALWPKIKKPKTSPSAHEKSSPPHPIPVTHVSHVTPVRRKDRVDGQPLVYNYVLPFEATTHDTHPGEELEASADREGDTIRYWVDGIMVGQTAEAKRAQMVEDFTESGDPCLAYILSDRTTVNLRFFRDRRKGQEWREQAVIIPVSYKGTARQETISVLSPGDPLELDEADAPGSILYRGEIIGKLPSKEWKRAEDEGIYGLFVEDVIEEEQAVDEYKGDYKTVYIPHIRIIWTDRAQ